MDKKIFGSIMVIGLLTAGVCPAVECKKPCTSEPVREKPQTASDPVDAFLKLLNDKTRELKSYQAQIEYSFVQPLLESEALRKGTMYYARYDKDSRLRINFQTLKQDDEKEQKYLEQYIFDGRWLTHINYQIKSVKKYELAEPNKPVDAFDIANRNLPLIGFTKIDDLKKQFDVAIVEQKTAGPASFVQLHLKVKPNSTYKDDYVSLDFWIDRKMGLPTKVVAVSTEDDIYRLKFVKPRLNKKIDRKIFEFKIPRGFGEPEIVPLKKKDK